MTVMDIARMLLKLLGNGEQMTEKTEQNNLTT